VIEDGAVAIEDDSIVAVGSYAELRSRFSAYSEIGSDQHVVIPGLINSHHHGWGLSTFQLGARDDYLEPWLIDLMSLRPVDPYLDALSSCMKLIRSGVTCVQHAGAPRDPDALEDETKAALRAYEDCGLRVAYGIPIQDRNTYAYVDDEEFLSALPRPVAERLRQAADASGMPSVERFLALVDELREVYAGHPRIRLLLGPQTPEWCTDKLLELLRQKATESNMGIHMHVLESPHQREYCLREYGRPALEHLDQLGFLGPDLSIAHGVWLTRAEMELCADRGVSVCHNPSSNLRLRVGVLPLASMLESGVNVALGMDSTTINDDEDMLQEMRLAAKLHGLPRGLSHAWGPTPRDVFQLATVNGARALGLADEIGVLEAHRRADAVLVNYEALAGPYVDPTLDLLDVIVQRGRADHVDTVVIGGEIVLADGRFTALDEDEITERLADSAQASPSERSRAWMGALREARPYVERFYQGWPESRYEPSYRINSPT